MFAKFIVTVILILIIGSLGSALLHLLGGRGGKKGTVRALTWRIGLSIVLFVGLIIAAQLGYIQPHGLRGVQATPDAASSQR